MFGRNDFTGKALLGQIVADAGTVKDTNHGYPYDDHAIKVVFDRSRGGYPYRAVCPCGWMSRGYVAAHAAQTMADDHRAGA